MGYNAGMISVAEALATAEQYVQANRPYCVVSGLLEDATDYFVMTELKPGMQWPIGPAAMVISKASGELRTEAYGDAMPRMRRATAAPVEDSTRPGPQTA